jgi:hypothetical protein
MQIQTNLHENVAKEDIRKVFFSGTGALAAGKGVCYDLTAVTTDTGETAADAWGKRGKIVALPTSANIGQFAGVAAKSYAANANGQWIEVYAPGAAALILTKVNAVVGVTNLVLSTVVDATQGFWIAGVGKGKGSCVTMQTMTVDGSDGSLVFALLGDGPGIIAAATIADTAAAAAACEGGSTPTATQVDAAVARAVAPLVVSINAILARMEAAGINLTA